MFKMKGFVVLLILGLVLVIYKDSDAQKDFDKFLVDSAYDLKQSGKMFYMDAGFLTDRTGSYGRISDAYIQLGQRVSVAGKAMQVNYIVATKIDRNVDYQNLHLRKGQVTCVAFENPRDYPDDEARDRKWIYIENCRPGRVIQRFTGM